MRDSNVSKHNELQTFCNALEKTDLVCNDCVVELKNSVRRVLIENPTWFINADDTNFPPNTNLHASCIVRFLAATKGFFDMSR